jgi:hypothetical protein
MSESIFELFSQRYQKLVNRFVSGEVTRQQFYEETSKLMACDESGRWWKVDPRDGSFLFYDNTGWLSGEPPEYPPPTTGGQDAIKPQPKAAIGSRNIAQELKSPSKKFLGYLGLIVPLITASIWLVYSWLVPSEQNDCLTPLIIAGIPFLFVYFRRPIDRLLLPIQPVRRPVPKIILYIISLAFPVVFGYVLGAITYSGYGVPRLVSLVGLLGGYALVRDPEVKQ